MTRVYFDGITAEYGCNVQGAMVVVNDDWTMTELVNAIRESGYCMFMLNSMRRYAEVPQA